MPNGTNASTVVLDSLERNASSLLDHAPLAAPQATLVTFAASAVLKFVRIGRDIHRLGEAKQRELADRLRTQIRPTLRIQPDPDLLLRREVTQFFVFRGRPNRDLRRGTFRPLAEAFEKPIEILAGNRRNDPLFETAVQDLAFVYAFLRPALAHDPPAFDDDILQRFYGEDIVSRDPERLKGIVTSVRDTGLEQYEHTPNWYRHNLGGFLYWQIASRHSLELSQRARAELQRQLDEQVRSMWVDAVFGEEGLLDRTNAVLGDYLTAKKQEALRAVDAHVVTVAHQVADLTAAREEARARHDIDVKRIEIDLEVAREQGDDELAGTLQAKLVDLERDWARSALDFDEEILDAEAAKRALERQREELDDA